MLTPEAAWDEIERHLQPLAPRPTPRLEAAGRVLAEAASATVDMPQADVSAMDGYVVNGKAAAGDSLPVVATAAAGAPLELELAPGDAAKIMTGAVVPPGGDRVIPVEVTDGGDERVVLHAAPRAGAHIRRGGEVVRRGAPLLPPGSLLTAGAISLLASHGYASVPAHPAPDVAVMTTGDELVPPEREPGAGQLRDSNTAFLLAAGHASGLEFRSLGIAADRVDDLRERIAAGLAADVLLLCGGVSMGEFDLVEDVLAELGCDQLFDRVAIQPGKPLVAARHAGGWVFGLPGNPASVMVTYWLFVKPVLDRLQGLPGNLWHGALEATLAAPLPGSKGRDRFLPAEVTFSGGKIRATPFPPRGSHDVVSYGCGTALVRIRPNAAPAEAGGPCEILPLANWIGGIV
ncbi:MAG: molybdopterin molybdotransferase MoeA [bacterium]|nr:molybdopterin molybdotransferase MoeA [bacterium]